MSGAVRFRDLFWPGSASTHSGVTAGWRAAIWLPIVLLALLAMLTSPLVGRAQSLPGLFYGKGLPAGASLNASIGGVTCGSTTVSAAGEWMLQILPGVCGATPGATVTFALDGAPRTAIPAAIWQSGGTPPADAIADGYVLVAPGSVPPTGSSSAAPAGTGASGSSASSVRPGAATATGATGESAARPGSTATSTPAAGGGGFGSTSWIVGVGVVVLLAGAALLLLRRWWAARARS